MTDRDPFMRMLKEADWDDLVPRLLAVANRRLTLKYHRSKGRNGWTCDDFVREGIGRMIEGLEAVDLNESLYTNFARSIVKLIERDEARQL